MIVKRQVDDVSKKHMFKSMIYTASIFSILHDDTDIQTVMMGRNRICCLIRQL